VTARPNPGHPSSLVIAVIGGLFAVAFLLNYYLLPQHQVVSSLYAIPVLVAAHRLSPRGIGVAGATAVAIYLTNAVIEDRPVIVWPFGVMALAAVTYLAVRFAVQRNKAAQHSIEIEESHEQLQEFLGLVGHDLAGALTGLVGYADLLVEDEGRVSRLQAAAAIDGASRRMRRLIDDLRDAASIGTGHFVMFRAPMDLGKLVDDLVLEHQARANGRHLIVDELEAIEGSWDEERLGQLFANLLSNAVNYSPPTGEIHVNVKRQGPVAVVSIADEGSGIPLDEQESLFRLFYRAGTAEGVKGMGLGLYIAKAIADAHGSCIWVESAPGQGSTFFVTLPLGGDSEATDGDRTLASAERCR
jgi:signal transduction histidine kinase